ncbi:MAG: hypothetical protein WBX15_18905, partial [Thermoanaerobaculia bacterium]
MAAKATISEMGPRDLYQQFRVKPLEIYWQVAHEMEEAGIEDPPTMSRVLETINPSEKGDSIDAFGRLLAEAGIRTRSNPEAGWWASSAADFLENAGTRALLSEFYARQWRKVSFGQQRPDRRTVLLSDDGIVGGFERPYYEATQVRWDQQIAPAIPLSEVVAMTTPISGQDYRSFYLTYDADQLRAFRVGESAEIPVATITGSEHTIRLHKYGRALQASYEELRRMRVDKLAYFIQLAAVQSEIDKVSAVINVLVNGDGNTGTTPTNYDLTALDAAAQAGTLTLKGYLAYKMKFAQPYVLTTMLVQEAVALQLALLNTGSANIPLANTSLANLGLGLTPINAFADTVRFGWTADAPALKILGFDRRFGVERVTEIGGQISETDRFINNQTQLLTLTEVEGYSILDAHG